MPLRRVISLSACLSGFVCSMSCSVVLPTPHACACRYVLELRVLPAYVQPVGMRVCLGHPWRMPVTTAAPPGSMSCKADTGCMSSVGGWEGGGIGQLLKACRADTAVGSKSSTACRVCMLRSCTAVPVYQCCTWAVHPAVCMYLQQRLP
jgi:hypothetical protein